MSRSKFDLHMLTDGASFQDGSAKHEIARLLRDAADRIERGHIAGTLLDENSNHVGRFVWRE